MFNIFDRHCKRLLNVCTYMPFIKVYDVRVGLVYIGTSKAIVILQFWLVVSLNGHEHFLIKQPGLWFFNDNLFLFNSLSVS